MNDISFNRTPVPASPSGGGLTAVEAERRRLVTATPAILQLLRIANRRKWALIGSVVLALILGLLLTLLMTPKYTASSTIEIQRESARVVNVQGVEPESGPADMEFYQTQYGLLRSDALAERVATELRLYDNPGFFEMFRVRKVADDLRQGGARPNAADRSQRIRIAARILLVHLAVDPERLSRLVVVNFTSPDPALSAKVVNTWTRLFIETSLGRRFEATSYARKFLEDRLEQLRQKLEQSERALVQYAANEKFVTIPGNAQGGATVERPVLAENLAVFNSELNAATAARLTAESRLRGVGALPEAISNQGISDLRTRRAQLAGERAKMLAQFKPDYPPVQALADQIADMDRSITRQESQVREALQSNYASALSRENNLRGRVSGLEADLLDLRRRTIQYNIFQRDVDTNRQLYDALLQRYKEIGVAGGVGVNNISIVDPAQVPEKPSSPNLILNLLVAALLGAAIGAGLALLLEQSDDAISDPRELEEKLGLPLLGAIPKSREEPLEDLEDPKSELLEAYLSVQARLAFSTEHGVPRTLAVTSTRAGEGKSTTAYALARSLSRTGRNVIIVDADMRSPSQHGFFEAENDRGLSNYLSGADDILSLVKRSDRGLTLMAAGPAPPNAAELLTSDRLGTLVGKLASMYEHVIIDAPPVMGLADTPLIASRTEGCIFVIESHKTRASVAEVAIGRLQASTVRILGGLLTLFDKRRADYGYGYDYGYGKRGAKAG